MTTLYRCRTALSEVRDQFRALTPAQATWSAEVWPGRIGLAVYREGSRRHAEAMRWGISRDIVDGMSGRSQVTTTVRFNRVPLAQLGRFEARYRCLILLDSFACPEGRNAKVPEPLRNADGWYEEDCEWTKVVCAFPALFTDRERRRADDIIRNEWPDYWEQLHGRALCPGESWAKDHRRFRETHTQNWIVVSAGMPREHPGMVECYAALGGKREVGERRAFLVPSDEYEAGRFGFVIDETRHCRI